jgi:hypothetical protein
MRNEMGTKVSMVILSHLAEIRYEMAVGEVDKAYARTLFIAALLNKYPNTSERISDEELEIMSETHFTKSLIEIQNVESKK